MGYDKSSLRALEERMYALGHASGLIYHDAGTVAPKGGGESRARTLGVLSSMSYALITGPELGELLKGQEGGEDDPETLREVELLSRERGRISRIPAEEYVAYTMLLSEAQDVWEKAKNENDFASFAPYLEKIIGYNRKFAAYFNPDKAPYDALLNEYEEGMDMKTLDAFFALLRAEIVPLLRKVQSRPPVDDSFLHKDYPVEQQRRFSDRLMDLIGLDKAHCVIGEVEHPYTTNFSNKDVRITTHYHADDVASSMFSVIHEGGHAIYELDCDDRYNYTVLSGGVSMGIHESQSRFYENIIGRSRAYTPVLLKAMREFFPQQLEGVDDEMFYRAVNKAQPSLIRTEADELTYCLHIMVRYELEKQLMDGTLSVPEIPAAWAKLYQEYLGVDVPNDKEGCLQDSHWSGGLIGYFPSYALGSAYGAQMFHVMQQELGDLTSDLERGDLSRIRGWLNDKIHRHAQRYKPGELFEAACGRFDAKYYTDYLKSKYE